MALPFIAAFGRIITSVVGRIAGNTALRAGLSDVNRAIKQGASRKQMVVKTRIDTREFDAAMKRYMEYTKKTIPEVINTKAYFVARNAVMFTSTTEPSKIEAQLNAPANVASSAPLAAILVNAKRGKQGETGLQGGKMKSAVNKLIRARKRSVNFLRSGWIPAIKAIERFVPKKGGAPPYKKVKTFGAPKGGAKGAKLTGNWRSTSEIWNAVTGGNKDRGLNSAGSPQRVASIIEDGLQKAVNKEVASMQAYVEKKMNEAAKKARIN